MLTVNLFKSMFNTQPETILIDEESKAIKDCVPDVDFENAIVFVNGFQKDKNYILKEGDVCTIRVTPASLTVFGIAVGVTALTTLGVMWGTNKEFRDWVLNGFQQTNKSLTNSTDNRSTKSIPCLTGAKNQDGFGKSVPMVLGRTINTPIICGSIYHSISGTDGEEQVQHACYLLGYSYLDVQDIKLGNTLLIKNNINPRRNGEFNSDEFEDEWTVGEYGYDGTKYGLRAELGQNQLPELYKYKVYEEPFSTELTNLGNGNKLELERFSAKYPMKIELEFTVQGLVKYDSKGTKKDASVDLQLKISYDGGNTYHPFSQITGSTVVDANEGIYRITKQKNKVMRFVATMELDAENAYNAVNHVAELYIARHDTQSTDTNVTDKVYLSAIRTWCYDPDESWEFELVPKKIVDSHREEMCTFLAFEVQATDGKFEGQLDELNCITTSRCYCYIDGKWAWNTSSGTPRQNTSNPAAIALNILKHDSRGKYAYDNEKIDFDSFGEFYEWCEQARSQSDNTPKFQCNGLLSSPKKTKDIIDAILACGRGKLILDGKKLSVWIDKPRTIPVMILNNQNTLSINVSKNLDVLPDGYKIRFINEQTWQTDEWKLPMKDPMPDNAMYESFDMLFQTSPNQIHQNANYQYAIKKLRPELWKVRVSVDGNLLDIGSLIEMQNDVISVGIGDGAEILKDGVIVENGYITKIKTDGNMYIDDLTKTYGVKITCADGVHAPKVMNWQVDISETGEQSEFVFHNPILATSDYKPNEGDIVSFGLFENETTRALCFGKKDNGDGTFDLTLVPYQDGIYTADSGEIPEFVSNVTEIPERSSGTYEVDKTKDDFAEINKKIYEIETSGAGVGNPDTVTNLTAIAKQDCVEVSWLPPTQGLANSISYCKIAVSKDGGTTWSAYQTSTTSFYAWNFVRSGANQEYLEREDLANWKFKVKAVNIYNLESVDSETTVDTTAYGTWQPVAYSALSKTPNEGGINFAWNQPTGFSNRTLYGSNRYEIEVYYNGTLRTTLRTTDRNIVYDFDRETDRYPEKVHDSTHTGLDLFTFKIKVINQSEKNAQSTVMSFAQTETANYGTWIPTASAITNSLAEKDGITFEWENAHASGNVKLYGSNTYALKLSYNETERNPIVTGNLSAVYTFNRSLDGYPEKVHDNDHRGLDLFKAKILVSNVSGNTAESAEFSIDDSAYRTWQPVASSFTVSGAAEYGIDYEWTSAIGANNVELYGTNTYKLRVYCENTLRTTVEQGATSAIYNFNRTLDGYPEKHGVTGCLHNLEDFTASIEVINESGNTATSQPQVTDESTYLGWKPEQPFITVRSSGRACTVNPYNSEERYGKIRYRYLVNNLLKDGDTFYLPTPLLNYYESEENYRDNTQPNVPLVADAPYTQTMPLRGQSATAYKLCTWIGDESVDEYNNGERKSIGYCNEQPFAVTEKTMEIETVEQTVNYWYDLTSEIHYAVYEDNGVYKLCSWTGADEFDEGSNQHIVDKENDPTPTTVTMAIGEDYWEVLYWYDYTNNFHYASYELLMPNPEDTEYRFKVQAFNEVANIAPEYNEPVTVTARATSAYDVVNGAITTNSLAPDAVTTEKIAAGTITAEKIFVQALAAISANLGRITDGELVGNENNFWYLSDEYNGSALVHRAGDFRVGGASGSDYIQCTTQDGTSYNIEIHASKFELTAVGTLVHGEFYVCDAGQTVDSSGRPTDFYAKITSTSIQMKKPVTISNTLLVSENATIEGDLYIGKGKAIYAKGTGADYPAIKFKDQNAIDGNGIVIGAGGATVIGAGESADTYYTGAGMSAGTETMVVTSDNTIEFATNLQNGYSSRKTMTMGTDGKLTNNNGFVGGQIRTTSTNDVTPTSYDTDPLVIGTKTGENIGIDSNEIMARKNGAVSTLYLNSEGGGVETGGAITSKQDNNSSLWINKNPRGKFVGSNGGTTGGWSPLLAGKTVGGKYEFGSLNNTVCLNYYKDNRTTNGVDKEVFSYTQDGTPSWNGSSTSVKDSGNGTLTTFAYSKAGLTGNPSWLAVWNNYELRAIAPSQITAGACSGNSASASRVGSRGNVDCETGTNIPAVYGISMSQVYNNGYPTTYGNVITLAGSGHGQLLLGWSGTSGARANAYIRSKRDVSSANWSAWYTLIDSGNIGNQSVNYANSSGSCSGNSATATTCTGVAYKIRIGNASPENGDIWIG